MMLLNDNKVLQIYNKVIKYFANDIISLEGNNVDLCEKLKC